MCYLPGCGGNSKPPEKQKTNTTSKAEKSKPAPQKKKVVKAKAAEKMVRHYDPAGKKDPFLPLVKEGSSFFSGLPGGAPLTPLQKYSLSELKLVAVIQAGEKSRAMVEDSKGDGYILTKGTLIGDRYGEVVEIKKDEVVIEEKEVDDSSGEIIRKTVSLILHKPEEEEL